MATVLKSGRPGAWQVSREPRLSAPNRKVSRQPFKIEMQLPCMLLPSGERIMSVASRIHRLSYPVCEKRGDIAHILVNRSDALNAIDAGMRLGLCRAFKAARHDHDIRGIVLSGGGGETLIGPDLDGPLDHDSFAAAESSLLTQTLLRLIEVLGKPVAAAINGVALGCWCEIAMVCRLRIATDTARFGMSEIMGGLAEDEMLDAYEAYDIGLVDEIVAPAELIERATAVVRHVAASAPAAARYASEAASRVLGTRLARPVSARAGIGAHAPHFANRWTRPPSA
ncbi:enoyl-CoA hydratase/isomerase family protein [Sphingomonas sp. JC676]|uniref:enoyl-CoA hydratase/isomerase family protein n=1 Tax=Sphingomonas sp. JC676 TaxID=2768065 RepID=UPI001657E53A|nr:enoyl-CoA hydratase/isomerase family protein [Sphingomonas sp. JC676]MBC9032641.1 enoyl-CoA hydratase/isomerase family protein [Sphingomonas sp. JC676]